MDWIALFFLIFVCILVGYDTYSKVNKLYKAEMEFYNPTRILIGVHTTKIGILDDSRKSFDETMRPANYVSCRVYSDGLIEFEGVDSEEFYKNKCEEYHKYLVPLSLGAKFTEGEKKVAREFRKMRIF